MCLRVSENYLNHRFCELQVAPRLRVACVMKMTRTRAHSDAASESLVTGLGDSECAQEGRWAAAATSAGSLRLPLSHWLPP